MAEFSGDNISFLPGLVKALEMRQKRLAAVDRRARATARVVAEMVVDYNKQLTALGADNETKLTLTCAFQNSIMSAPRQSIGIEDLLP